MAAMSPRQVRVEAIAWLAAILPLAAANIAYLISASQELVPWCVPYIEGCTSVSRAARHGAANAVFRGIMLPYAVVQLLFWWLTVEWLRGFLPDRRRIRAAILVLGMIAPLAMAMYTAVLGMDGSFYQWMRRYGINLNFALTVLDQILLTSLLTTEPRLQQNLRRAMVGLCTIMLVLGLASIPLQYFTSSRSPALNAIEWTYSVLMLSFFPLVGLAWRRTGFRVRFSS